jgi:predicted amidophosphoribosyltransferase
MEFKRCLRCSSFTDSDEARCTNCGSPLNGESISLQDLAYLLQKEKVSVFTRHYHDVLRAIALAEARVQAEVTVAALST